MISIRTKYTFSGLGVISVALVGSLFYFYTCADSITDYNPQRDRDDVLSIFKTDWYWLIPDETTDFSPEYVIDNRASSKKPEHKGNLIIKVCRAHGEFCGFVAYHQDASYKGRILFLATAPRYRGKGFGKKLLYFAIKDLFNRGCVVINIFTRVNNERALALYYQAGFKESWRNEKYIRLSKSYDE